MIKEIIVKALKNNKEVAFRFGDKNNFHANILLDDLSTDPDWIYVRHAESSHNRLINLKQIKIIAIED